MKYDKHKLLKNTVGHSPAPTVGHPLYAAWAAAAAALASQQHSHQTPLFWPNNPLSHAALFQQSQQNQHKDDLEHKDKGDYKFVFYNY